MWLMNCERVVKSGVILMFNNVGSFVFVNVDGFSVWIFNMFGVGVVGGKFLENGNIVF